MGFVTKLLGDVTGANAANAANKTQGKAVDIQRRQFEEQSAFAKMLQQLVRQYKGQGMFDADARIASANREADKLLDRTLQSAAGADRIAGFKPGDASPTHRRDVILAQDYGNRINRNEAIRDQVMQNELAMTAGTRPEYQGSANAYSGALQNQALMQMGQAGPGAGGLLGALMPFLTPKMKPAQAFGSSSYSPAGGYGMGGFG